MRSDSGDDCEHARKANKASNCDEGGSVKKANN
jgi:hypothetical protein